MYEYISGDMSLVNKQHPQPSHRALNMALAVLTLVMVAVATVSAQYGYKPAYTPEPYAPPKYEFAYAVNDPHTYDVKSQKESRDGDVVYGVYELLEPDGSKRVVTYEDTGYGFQAKVDKLPAAGYYPRY